MDSKRGLLAAGGVVGLLSVLLVVFGNPANMGYCIACFIRDIAGGVGMHRADVVQYARPEVMGLVIGAFIMAKSRGEFASKGGSAPFIRFFLGALMMISALVFLGCPLRMVLRLAGGDLNALPATGGFVVGIAIGIFFLNRGYNLKRNYTLAKSEGYAFPLVNVLLLVVLIAFPGVLFFSENGPGSMRAPLFIALASGLIVGALAQRTRLCTMGGIRDIILFRDNLLFLGFAGIFIVAFVGNLVTGNFNLGLAGQPVAHTETLWNFLGMLGVGFSAVLLGGCPLRQLILAAEGNTDSAITVMGLLVGAAFAHNMSLASSPAGATPNGKLVLIIGLAIMAGIAYLNSDLAVSTAKGGVNVE
ncbi:YedE family putative selenium transporter [Anoxynatronum sibiricum]|uniref:YedE family putative selenium transporter n=1 Tax=Anoxynatronum sibiricum TaxID=210623 RepID=A0ABU9VR45_9CLOT